jgi:hypothetical protein
MSATRKSGNPSFWISNMPTNSLSSPGRKPANVVRERATNVIGGAPRVTRRMMGSRHRPTGNFPNRPSLHGLSQKFGIALKISAHRSAAPSSITDTGDEVMSDIVMHVSRETRPTHTPAAKDRRWTSRFEAFSEGLLPLLSELPMIDVDFNSDNDNLRSSLGLATSVLLSLPLWMSLLLVLLLR